jgi:hypothetical protein
VNEKDAMESCKQQLKTHIESLLDIGVRRANIEIDLHFYIKGLLKEH